MSTDHDTPVNNGAGIEPAKDKNALRELFETYRAYPCERTREALITAAYFRIRNFYLELYLAGRFTENATPDQLLTRAFGKFIRKHAQIRNPQAFSAWLHRLCLREYFKHCRAALTFITTDDENVLGGTLDIDEAILSDIDRETLMRIVNAELRHSLHPRVMETLGYKLMTNLTNEEIAVKMGINPQTVKNLYHRAVTGLRTSKAVRDIVLKWKNGDL